MESRIDQTRFEGDANFFLHRVSAPQSGLHRVFDGASALIALARFAPEKVQTVGEIEREITLFPGSLLALERRTGLRKSVFATKKLVLLILR